MPELNKLFREYRDRVAFYVVYIQEAHPVDAWQVDDNVRDKVLLESTETTDERVSAANVCVTNLGIELPAVIDGPDNRVEQAYTGWPDRLYVINTRGEIAYKSAAGPFGFKPAAVEAVLKRLVPETAAGGTR